MKEEEDSAKRLALRLNSAVIPLHTDGPNHRPISLSPPKPSNQPTPVKPLTILEELDLKFGSASSKHDVIKALETCNVLHRIPLPEPNVSIEQALKDFYREKVLLNDVAFIPDKHDDDRSHGFSQTLHVLLSRMTTDTSTYNFEKYGDSKSVGNLLMQRACRTSAGADSFFTVQKLLCTEGTFLTQKTLEDDPPVLIDVFLASRNPPNELNPRASISFAQDLCARVQVSNSFAIFDVESVDEITGIEAEDPQPWLDVESVVVDETNFREGVHWRKLHLIVTNPETGVTYTSNDSTSALTEALRASGRITSRKILQDLSSWFTINRPISHRTDETMTTHSSMAVGRDNPSEVSSVNENNNNTNNNRNLRFFRW
mmetsp:Transcript_24387/g.26660  ORF Transcript_24387/g.26660 Transcript_24387/m.26660 type:complete len:372 (+) Transcript_24387:101-1216(+)|eukprot:gene1889-2021_t